MISIEPISSDIALVGENPLWDVDEQRIYWVDTPGKKIFKAAPDGRDLEAWDAPMEIGSMCLRNGGGAVVALEKGIHLFDFATGRFELLADPEDGQSALRLNDGKVDGRGRFVVGSYDAESYDPARPGVAAASRASLFRLDPDLTVHAFDTGIACVNGPCWSPDQRVFYYADTVLGVIWAADWYAEAGTIAGKRRFLTCGPGDGMPDGATVDAEGFFWCAFFGSGTVRRYAPDGSLDRTIEFPARNVTSVMFGGPELDTIYVTSAGGHFGPPGGALGGHTFVVRGLGIRGVAERKFAG
jgi:sugar lactone lactonase YvrE